MEGRKAKSAKDNKRLGTSTEPGKARRRLEWPYGFATGFVLGSTADRVIAYLPATKRPIKPIKGMQEFPIRLLTDSDFNTIKQDRRTTQI